jgi:hypothetical protein
VFHPSLTVYLVQRVVVMMIVLIFKSAAKMRTT